MSLHRNLNVWPTYTDRIIAMISDFIYEVFAFQFVRKRLQPRELLVPTSCVCSRSTTSEDPPPPQFTHHATSRRFALVQAMSAWLVKTRRAPSRRSRDVRVYGLWSHDYGQAQTEYSPPSPNTRAPSPCMCSRSHVPL